MSGWFLLLLILSLFPPSVALDCDDLPNDLSSEIDEIYKKCAQSDTIGTSYGISLRNGNPKAQMILENKSLIKASFTMWNSYYNSFRFSGQHLVIDAGGDEIYFGFNSDLESIQIPRLKSIKAQRLVIEKNLMLKNFSFPESATIEVTEVKIRGNKRLERRWLKLLAKKLEGKGYIQEYGECLLRGKITDVAELEGCEYVNGDLIFHPNAIQSRTYSEIRLSKVLGCINIQNTRLTSLSFLRNTITKNCTTANTISDNPLICDADKISRNITGTIQNNCHIICLNLSELMWKTECHTLNSDLIVDNNTDPLLLEQLKRIQRINGIVKVIGTDLDKIDFLMNILFIVSTRPGPVLVIRDNLNLKELILDGLVNSKGFPGMVVAPTTSKLYIKHNGLFKLTEEQFKKLQQILIDPNSIEADVDMKPPKDIYSDEGIDENDSDFDFHAPIQQENNTLNPTRSNYFITVCTLVAVAIVIIAEGISVLIKYVTHKFKQQVVDMDGAVSNNKKSVVEPKLVSVTASDRSFYDTPNEENKSSVKPPTDSDNSNVTSRNPKPSPQSSDVSTQVSSQNPSSQNPSSQNQSSQQQK